MVLDRDAIQAVAVAKDPAPGLQVADQAAEDRREDPMPDEGPVDPFAQNETVPHNFDPARLHFFAQLPPDVAGRVVPLSIDPGILAVDVCGFDALGFEFFGMADRRRNRSGSSAARSGAASASVR